MRKIFKYPVELKDKFELELPVEAEILTVQSQYGKPQMWVMVDPDAEKEWRTFRLVGTGHPIHFDMGSVYDYINTFQVSEGKLVFHLFEMR